MLSCYVIGNFITTEKLFLYDESGVIGMIYTNNGTSTTYYFQRNIQGDVIGVYDTNGNEVAKYGYDAWGKCTILSTTNSTIAYANPFRYRGYYLDSETGWYFLNARYYSPEWRRFISPDDTAFLDSETPNGLNLYCYCNNDPVNYADPSGHEPLSNIGKWIIGGLAFAGAVALTALTGGALLPLFIGMASSIVLGGLIEGTMSGVNGGSFWQGFWDGAADGAMWGGIFAFGGAALRTVKMFKNGVAIGENMTRVKKLAQIGHQITYKPMPGYKLISSIWGEEVARNLSMQHNRRFIERMVKMGVTIVDFGIDASRPNRSFYYLMETLFTTGYEFLKIMY